MRIGMTQWSALFLAVAMVTAPDVGMRTPSAVARPNTHVWGASGWHAPLRELLEAAVEHRSTCVRPLTSTILRLSNNTDSATALNATLEASSELESSADGMAVLRRRTQKRCQYPDGCHRQSTFGDATEMKALYCHSHKAPSHINVRAKQCSAPNCLKFPTFGDPAVGVGVSCSAHHKEGHIDVVHARCEALLCSKQAAFAPTFSHTPRRCAKHRHPEDVDCKHKTKTRSKSSAAEGCREGEDGGEWVDGGGSLKRRRVADDAETKRRQQALTDILRERCNPMPMGLWSQLLTVTPTQATEVLDFLQELSVPTCKLGRVLGRAPQLLSLSAERNLRPTALFLMESLRVDDKDVGRIVAGCPSALCLGIGRDGKLPAMVAFLRNEVGIAGDKVGGVVLTHPGLLMYSIDHKLRPLLRFLTEEAGVELGAMERIIRRYPPILGLSVNEKLRPGLAALAQEFDLDKDTSAEVVTAYPQVLGYSLQHHVIPIRNFFISELGIGAEVLRKIVITFPQILGFNVDRKLRAVVRCLEDDGEMSREEATSAVVSFPVSAPVLNPNCIQGIFSYSLEGRIRPRLCFLRQRFGDRKLPSAASVMTLPDNSFYLRHRVKDNELLTLRQGRSLSLSSSSEDACPRPDALSGSPNAELLPASATDLCREASEPRSPDSRSLSNEPELLYMH